MIDNQADTSENGLIGASIEDDKLSVAEAENFDVRVNGLDIDVAGLEVMAVTETEFLAGLKARLMAVHIYLRRRVRRMGLGHLLVRRMIRIMRTRRRSLISMRNTTMVR